MNRCDQFQVSTRIESNYIKKLIRDEKSFKLQIFNNL